MQIFDNTDTCRECSECVGTDHHWLLVSFPPEDADDPEYRRDVLEHWKAQPESERPTCPIYWACKHCAAWTPDDPEDEE